MGPIQTAFLALSLALSRQSLATTNNNNNITFPTAHTLNGTYIGLHNSSTNLDYFLGIPFAQAPINDLRFRNPRSLNTSWTGNRLAHNLGTTCVGYGSDDDDGLVLGEDCLNLNLVRPALGGSNASAELLPVAVWIYGGGYYEGSANRRSYNQTRFVMDSVEMGMPVIGVGINYRLSAFGYASSHVMGKA
jgi:carboxylesterase type B